MFALAPPVKVARTQRQHVASCRAPARAETNSEEDDNRCEAQPCPSPLALRLTSGLDEQDTEAASTFLCGVGRHLCWLVDENADVLRVWNLSLPSWHRAHPRMEYLPRLSAMPGETPLYICEIESRAVRRTTSGSALRRRVTTCTGDEALAFCTEHGVVTSLDRSLQFRLFAREGEVVVSSFACAVLVGCRGATAAGAALRCDCGDDDDSGRHGGSDAVLTVVGTIQGQLLAHLKHHGEHATAQLNRQDYCAVGDAAFSGAASVPPPTASSRRWWSSLKALLAGGAQDETQETHTQAASYADEEANEASSSSSAQSAASMTALTHLLVCDGINDTPSSPTRSGTTAQPCPLADLLLVTARTEICLVSVSTTVATASAASPAAGSRRDGRRDMSTVANASVRDALAGLALQPRWCCDLRRVLGLKDGRVLAVAEVAETVCALVLAANDGGGALPSLRLVSLHSVTGQVVSAVTVNTVVDALRAASEVATRHVHLHIDRDDRGCHVLIFFRQYCIRVNTQVGVHSPCTSADTTIIDGLQSPITSVLLLDEDGHRDADGSSSHGVSGDGGTIVTLDTVGPCATLVRGRNGRLEAAQDHAAAEDVTRIRDTGAAATESNNDDEDESKTTYTLRRVSCAAGDTLSGVRHALLAGGGAAASPREDRDADRMLADVLRAVRADSGRTSLDDALLHLSDELAMEAATTRRGGWARLEANAEDAHVVLHVTRQLRRRQQAHRRLVLAVLRQPEEVRATLAPQTLAHLLSTQEALLCLLSLRNLQNVGTVHGGSSEAALLQPYRSVRCIVPGGVVQPSRMHAHPTMAAAAAAAATCNAPMQSPCSSQGEAGRPTMGLDGGSEVCGGDARTWCVPVLQTSAQVRLCQDLLREAVLQVGQELRAEAAATTDASGGDSGSVVAATPTATIAELVFAKPMHLLRVLRTMATQLARRRRGAVLGAEDKLAASYAVGCVFVIVAQTIVESREEMARSYLVPAAATCHVWTRAQDAATGLAGLLEQCCMMLSSALADTADAVQHSPTRHVSGCDGVVDATPGASRGDGSYDNGGTRHNAHGCRGRAAAISGGCAAEVMTLQTQLDMLDVLAYLLHLIFADHDASDHAFFSDALRRVLLCEPFAQHPMGYPHGPPQCHPDTPAPELCRRALRLAESMALGFGALDVLLDYALARPVADPLAHAALYLPLQSYCLRLPQLYRYALQRLWAERREWELLCLHTVLPAYANAQLERDAFLESEAPQLLWLATPGRFDALVREGAASWPAYVAYGPDALSHRTRCLALARLSWVAAGAPECGARAGLELSSAIVTAQRRFLGITGDAASLCLGPQELVQRLLNLGEAELHRACPPASLVEAWLAAAEVACRTVAEVRDDLLVQILRRCKAHDGAACLASIQRDSLSELELTQAMKASAIGTIIAACASVLDFAALDTLCASVLAEPERRLVTAWLATCWPGAGHDTNYGSA